LGGSLPSATDFGNKAQPAQQSEINKAEINKTKPIRIRVASGKPQQPTALTSSSADRQLSPFSV
jgi:hypothetical protein